MVYAATDDRTVGELCPISRSAHTCITRPHMENAIRVAAKRLVLSAPIHAVSHALSLEKHREKYWFGVPVFIYSTANGARFQRQSAIRRIRTILALLKVFRVWPRAPNLPKAHSSPMRLGRHAPDGRKTSAVLEMWEEGLPRSRSPNTKAARDVAGPLTPAKERRKIR